MNVPDIIILAAIAAVAVVLIVRYVKRFRNGQIGDCGCGRGKDCVSKNCVSCSSNVKGSSKT